MHNTIARQGRRSRFMTALAVILLVGAVPAATLGASASPAVVSTAAPTGVANAPSGPLGQRAIAPAARPNPDQVPLVAFSGAGTGARLVVSAPASVAVGQTITVIVKAAGVTNLAGYEGVLRFDSSAAEFDSLNQRALALGGSGRDVRPLGPVVIPAGVAFGLYSCSVAGCGDGSTSAVRHAGASGTVVLAKLTLLPTKAGVLSIALGSMRFVDAAGKLLTVNLPGAISVTVGAGGTTFAAPAAPALTAGPASAVSSADISGDGFVGPADLNTAAIAWGLARESGKDCGLVNDPADLNHDGCIDVQDLQLIAARVAARPAVAASLKPASILVFTVDSTSDAVDKLPGDGICATAANVCSLRAAISEANLASGPNTINFNIPGGGVQTITIGSTLPVINDTTGGVTIDGYTQPGASPNTDPDVDNAVITVQITATSTNTDALFFSSSDNLIRGVAMYHTRRSITFQTSSARNNAVTGSFIGTNAAGTYYSTVFVSGGNGINVTQGASFSTIGGTDPADRNVITGNEANGFSTYDEQTDHNTVEGNLIGLAPNGQSIRTCSVQCYGQVSHGIDINTGSSYNMIGGLAAGARNVISNNRGEAIEFSHSTTTDSNQAIGNYIGTDVTGNGGAANKFGNGLNGVHFEDGTTNDIVAFNVIANNAQRADGTEVMGGIAVEGFYTSGGSIHDNMIGVGADGVTPMPNNFFGVDIHFNASWITVGPNNIIANNPSGVIVSDPTDLYNTITQNSIYNNGSTGSGRGIQLLNHANNSIAVATLNPNGVSLTAATGAACAGCTVEAFRAISDVGDASAGQAGQGKVYLGSALVPVSGAFTVGFNTTLNPGNLVTVTVTDPAGDTSQFSPNEAAASISSPTPPPTPAPTPTPNVFTYASDTFTRALSATWGQADIGGSYAGFYCTNPDMNVNGNAGTVLLPDPHNPTICPKDSTVNTNFRGGYLTNVDRQDVDIRFRVATATLASGDNINVGFDVRRASGFTSYRGQVRLTTANQVWLQANTVVNNVMTPLGSNTHATAASVTAGTYIWVRGQITGSSFTTIKMKAWTDGTAEPAGWVINVTDSTSGLQGGGAVGILGWQSAASTTGPITVKFDDLNVTSPIAGTVPAAPVADFTFAQTLGSLDVQFSDASTGGTPDTWWWDFGDGSHSTAANPLHTYAIEGTYPVTLTTVNDGGTSTKSIPVTVDPIAAGTPAASFTSLQGAGTLGVQFTDTSTNTPTSWAWDFGDGNTSASQNPHHNYTAPGSYAVTLMATNAIGTGSTSHSITVVPLPLPGATYITVAPTRLVDSRSAKGGVTHLAANVHQTFRVSRIAPLSIPVGAVAITGNLTVTNQTTPGFFFLGPVAANAPTSSTLNFPLGDTRANGVTVRLGTGAGSDKYLSITYAAKTGNHADVILDITGYFINTAAGSTYFTVTPTRIVDSRPPSPVGLLTHLQANVHQTFNVAGVTPLNIPAEATAVTGNLTVTGQTAAGYFALTPAFNDIPTSSTLNFPAHDTRANNVTVALGPGGTLSVTYAAVAGNHAEVIFDITGYFMPDTTGAVYVPITPTRLADSRDHTGGVSPLTANTGVVFLVADGTPVAVNAVALTGNLTVTGQTAAGFLALTLTAIDAPTNSTLNFPKGDTRANGADVPIGPGNMIGITYGATTGKTTQFIFDVTGYFVPSS